MLYWCDICNYVTYVYVQGYPHRKLTIHADDLRWEAARSLLKCFVTAVGSIAALNKVRKNGYSESQSFRDIRCDCATTSSTPESDNCFPDSDN